MTEIISKSIYNVDLLSHIQNSYEIKDNHVLDLTVKENGKNHYWDRKISFETAFEPDLKLSKQGVLSYLDRVGNRAGISLEMFDKVNHIKLDEWRK